MNCEITDRDQHIDDFLLKKLSPEDAEAFEIHLFGRPECLEELRVREQMVKLIKAERITMVAEAVKQPSPKTGIGLLKSIAEFFRVRPTAWIYAGAAAVLLIVFFASRFLLKKEPAALTAANFAESRYLESVMQQTFQSSELALSVISPAVGENFTGDIVFHWQAQKNGEEFKGLLDLKIMNNTGTPVHTATIEGQEYHLKTHLTSGLYYWTLEEQGQMLYLGKFFVNKSVK